MGLTFVEIRKKRFKSFILSDLRGTVSHYFVTPTSTECRLISHDDVSNFM